MAGEPVKTTELLTLEDFERLSEQDAHRTELVRGRVVREPRPGARHGWLVQKLFGALQPHVEQRGLGIVVNETGFLLSVDPPTVRGPDLAVIRSENLPREDIPEGFWTRAPDLAIEVLSPSNSAIEMREKVLDYLAAGTPLVWVVDPHTRTVAVHGARYESCLLTVEDDLEGGEVLPGLRIALADLFAPYRPPAN